MAMGPERGQGTTLQLEMTCVDELVPEDDLYRRIDALLEWGFVRPAAAPYYAEGVGRPSVDPVVLLKLMLAGALEGIGSMRELLRVASLRLDLRRFLGYGLAERLPAHQTVSEAHSRRFLDGALFEQLFARTVALCREHELLEGTHLSVDGFHLEANAALESLRASLAPLAEAAPAPAPAPAAAEQAPAPPALRLGEPGDRPGPAPAPLNERLCSRTDPDSRLRRKPNARTHLVYRGQIAVDPKARCVVACLAERADGFEGDGLAPLLDRARFHLPHLRSLAADAGYAAERVWEEAERRGLEAFVPPQAHMLPDPTRAPRTRAEELARAARERCRSPEGRRARRRRLADAEGVIGEGKLQHALARARCRSLPLVEIQLRLGCAAINLKRLASRLPTPASGVAAASAQAAAPGGPSSRPDGRENACRRTSAGFAAPATSARTTVLHWTVTICLN